MPEGRERSRSPIPRGAHTPASPDIPFSGAEVLSRREQAGKVAERTAYGIHQYKEAHKGQEGITVYNDAVSAFLIDSGATTGKQITAVVRYTGYTFFHAEDQRVEGLFVSDADNFLSFGSILRGKRGHSIPLEDQPGDLREKILRYFLPTPSDNIGMYSSEETSRRVASEPK